MQKNTGLTDVLLANVCDWLISMIGQDAYRVKTQKLVSNSISMLKARVANIIVISKDC